MGVEGVVLLIALEGGGMRRSPPPPRAKDNFDLDGEGLVAAVACLSFESVLAVSLVSSSSLERKSSSAREGGANLAVPIRIVTSCKCKRKR